MVMAACGGDSSSDDGGGGGGETDTGFTNTIDITQVVEQAIEETKISNLQVQGRETMYDFLTTVVQSVGPYWVKTLTAAGFASPNVTYYWMAPGEREVMACTNYDETTYTDDTTAAYCPDDDSIYVSQQMAYELWNGIVNKGAGPEAYSVRPGDFGVAYVVAHEYAHNVQHELGIYEAHPELPVINFELQADCMAGAWANSTYYQGVLETGDVEEAIATAALLGDYAFENPGHHGTPQERTDAWLLGYNTGNPAECNSYVP